MSPTGVSLECNICKTSREVIVLEVIYNWGTRSTVTIDLPPGWTGRAMIWECESCSQETSIRSRIETFERQIKECETRGAQYRQQLLEAKETLANKLGAGK